jgi:hypothetical protein
MEGRFVKNEQADGRSKRSGLKKVKRRRERKRAKRDPEGFDTYKVFKEYQS